MKVFIALVAVLAVASAMEKTQMPGIGDYAFEHGVFLAQQLGVNMTSAEEEMFSNLRMHLNQNMWKAHYLGNENPYFGEHLFTGVNEEEFEAAVARDEMLAETGGGSGSGCQISGDAPAHLGYSSVILREGIHNVCSTGRDAYNALQIGWAYQFDQCKFQGTLGGLGNAKCGCACSESGYSTWWTASKMHMVQSGLNFGFTCLCGQNCRYVWPSRVLSFPRARGAWDSMADSVKSFFKPLLCNCVLHRVAEAPNCSCAFELTFALIYPIVHAALERFNLPGFFKAKVELASDLVGCFGKKDPNQDFQLMDVRERIKVAAKSFISASLTSAVIELAASFVPVVGWVKTVAMAKTNSEIVRECFNDFWNVAVKVVRWFELSFCYQGERFNGYVLLDAALGAVSCYIQNKSKHCKSLLVLTEEVEVVDEPAFDLAEIKERALSTWDADIAEALEFFTADTSRDHTAGIGFLNGLRDYVRAL